MGSNSDDWRNLKWGDLVELKYGKSLKGYKGNQSGVPVFGTNGQVGFCSQVLCDFPSIIIGRKGAYRGVHFSDEPFYVIDTAFYIVPKVPLNIKWAYYELLTQDINGLDSGSAIPSTRREDFYSLPVKVPPLQYQDKLVNILDNLNFKVRLNQNTNQTLEQMAQALFKSWFVDFDPVVDNALAAGNPIPEELAHRVEVRKKAKALPDFQPLPEHIRNLFPSEFEQTGESTVGIDGWVPKSWLLTPFGELLDKTIGGDWGKDSIDEKHTERCRIIRGTDIPNISESNFDRVPDRWVQEKKLKSRCLKHGDIVIEVSGGSPTQSTGRSLKITEKVIDQLGGIVAPASFCRLFRPLREHLSAYLSEHLLYIYGEGKMWGYQNQSTGISNFQTKIFLASELLAVPNEKLLAEFEKTISNFDRKKYIGQTATLAALRDYLLPKLISGEIQLDFLTDGNANQEAELQGV